MLKEIYKSKILTNKKKKCLLCKKAHLGYLNFYYYIYLYKKKVNTTINSFYYFKQKLLYFVIYSFYTLLLSSVFLSASDKL